MSKDKDLSDVSVYHKGAECAEQTKTNFFMDLALCIEVGYCHSATERTSPNCCHKAGSTVV